MCVRADKMRGGPAAALRLDDNNEGAAKMPGLNAEEIVADYLQWEEWPDQVIEGEAEPVLDLPPLPPPRPEAA